MDPTLKQKWTAALRGGQYRQGRNRLRSADDCFCVVGVLADVCGYRWELDPVCNAYFVHTPHGKGFSVLPPETEKELGLLDRGGAVINLNDRGATFAHLADFIDANF